MNRRDLHLRVKAALEKLVARDWQLLEYSVSERAVAAKLRTYLARLFHGYDVDVEYNRHGLDPKALNLPASCRGGGRRRVYPDIVVHRRGHDKANLLVVEVKKETNSEPRTCDRAKIRAMKRQFGYRWGILIELPAGRGAAERKPKKEWL